MVEATRRIFTDVYSIEVGPNNYENAKKRFKSDPNVHILFGDGGSVLKELLPTLPEKLLFYLDSHFPRAYDSASSQDLPPNPTTQELDTIFSLRPKSVVLIDDARLFRDSSLDGNICIPRLDR